MEEGQEKQSTKGKTSAKLWIGLLIIVVLIIAFVASDFATSPEAVEIPDESFRPIDENVGIADPEEGEEVVRGFPSEVLTEVGEGADVLNSYALRYFKEGFDQPFVEYRSESNLGDNVEVLERALEGEGWEILHHGEITEAPNTYTYATRDNETMNISYTRDGQGTKVKMVYVKLSEEIPEEEL